jgi:hypothetical protein
LLGWAKWTLTSGIRGMGCEAAVGADEAARFSPTSSTEGGHTQHIRETFLPSFSPGFWDGVSSLLIVGLYAHKRPERRLSVGLGQIDANI